MIPASAVTDAILAHLADAVPAPVGDHTAPDTDPMPKIYHVLESPPGSTTVPTGGVTASGARRLRYRVRTVANLSHVAASRQAAEIHADGVMLALTTRAHVIDGDGWEIGARLIVGDSGVITDSGPAANVVRDYELFVAPGPAQPAPS